MRDVKRWSEHLDSTTKILGLADLLYENYRWPTWGKENFVKHYSDQRNLYDLLPYQIPPDELEYDYDWEIVKEMVV